jgi:phospholipid/cholesterol/gamma-HCH transport system substrate-binding protein
MNIRNILLGNGRPPKSDVLIARGVIFSIITGLIVGGLFWISRGVLVDRVDATATFKNAGGSLVKSADVKFEGINVGKVYDLREGKGGAAKGGVELDMHIEEKFAKDIPSNVTGRVMPQSIFGTSFVDLVRPANPTGRFENGTNIVQDTSLKTLELQQILDGLDRVVRALGPADLSNMLGNLGMALDGNGEQIGQTITQLDSYLGKLNPKLPLVNENLDLLAGNLEAFQKAAPDLFAATDNILVTARTLKNNEANFHKLVTHGGAFLGQTDALLTKNEKALVDTLTHTAIVVDALYDGRVDLVRGVAAIGTLSRNLTSLVKNNAMVRTDATVVNPTPGNYTSGDCFTYNGLRGRGC